MTEIHDVIAKGDPIPDDVIEVRDADPEHDDTWKVNQRGWYCIRFWPDGGPPRSGGYSTGGQLSGCWGPLTVTAVRGRRERRAWAFNEREALTLESAVHQAIGGASMCWEHIGRAGVFDDVQAAQVADVLLAKIRELLPQQPVQARNVHGDLLWLSESGAVVHHGERPSGAWRPLLVGGNPAPEPTRDELRALLLPVWQEFATSPDEPGNDMLVRWVQRMIDSRELDRRALKDMMAQVERQRQPSAPDFLASLNTLTIQRDEARGESEKRLDALIEARAEVERLRSKLERGHVCTPACSPNRHVAHVGRHALDDARARLGTVEADRETIRGSLNYLKDTVTRPAIELLGVQYSEDIVPAIKRLKAAQPGPQVLSLSTLEPPPGTAALIGKSTRVRYVREDTSPVTWRGEGYRDAFSLLEVFQDGGPELEVELALPRGPRTAAEVWASLHRDERESITASLGFPHLVEALDREAEL